MKLVKVDATKSTNLLSKELNAKYNWKNFCVSAEYQEEGRGQQLNKWQSKKSKNLTFTLVYNHLNLKVDHQFILNILICLKIIEVLNSLNVNKLKLKWPNDILAGSKKICGILIENSLLGYTIKTSYIGIGINVNQKKFDDLPNADSLINILGRKIKRDWLLDKFLEQFSTVYEIIENLDINEILNQYKAKLFKFNEISEFKKNNDIIKGKITDIESDGRLMVTFDNGLVKKFQHKEISQII